VAVFVSRPVVSLTLAASAAAGVVCDLTALDTGGAAQAEQLRSEAERFSRSQRMSLAFVHARGDPATELLRVAGGVHADLIVVGRSTKARHRVAGSLGRHLVTEPGAPVVVVVP
jgi:nucleotide-binding universal stress UspA family protein